MRARFPAGFTWGVSTSAYQIEGGKHQGGKGESIWDRFAAETSMPDSGDVACDHYNRWPEDIALLADLGVNAYRFSIAWTRILPQGVGTVNPEGIEFYSNLVDALLDQGIMPWPTLYHWDLPQALQDGGGWTERSTVTAFAEYAGVIAAALGDRVMHWITHNEPWVAAFLGHVDGVFAPGITDWPAGLTAAHHILLSHGEAVRVIRETVPDAVVGIAIDCRPSRPASDDAADVAAAQHFDGYRNRWFFDPVFGRGYPNDMVHAYHQRGRLDEPMLPFVEPGDMDTIAEPVDFLGLNYYTSIEISAGADETEETGQPPSPDPPEGVTEMDWPITPRSLTAYLTHLRETYRPPAIVITENGASYSDAPDASGVIDDQRRIEYLESHLDACARALEAGVPLTGYFVWSLLDNLEWVLGFSQRFGLVWVDHATCDRIPKASYHWYRDFITNR